ncbi:MAG TPA: DUF3426 domain-containing protein [Caulobacteraceae bacterium]|jgi:predicted Zn finger-like uncharacterized protein|nr:DUF3426 domain-containing protein [Caulobacteraceae bacterium]
MILTCPECASRYFVDDDSIGEAGRVVRCSSCNARWTAYKESVEPAAPPTPELVAAAESAPAAEPVGAPVSASEPLPRTFRERAATQKKVREAATVGAVWAGLLACFGLLIGVTVIMRQDIARIWPRTAGAYAMAGLPVNLVGLIIENQHAQPQLQDGHAALVISGSLRNIRDRPVASPPLRISLLNAAGRPLAVKFADPDGARIPPGEARRFVIDMLDPPVSATDVDIAFVMDRSARPAAGAPLPARLSLRGADAPSGPPGTPIPSVPAAQPVQPLPNASPYALPKGGEASAGASG